MEDLQTDDEPILEPEKVEEKGTRSDNRFKDLAEKVKTTAEERDKFAAEKATAEKELEFYKSFSKLKQPEAIDYQEKIKEKYLAGYDMDDAAISVLAKAGKYTAPQVRQSPAGGSASTSVQSPDDKPVGEMSREEKRLKLLEFERENPGQLSETLRHTNMG